MGGALGGEPYESSRRSSLHSTPPTSPQGRPAAVAVPSPLVEENELKASPNWEDDESMRDHGTGTPQRGKTLNFPLGET